MSDEISMMKDSIKENTEAINRGRKQRAMEEEKVKTTMYLPRSLWLEAGYLSREERTSVNSLVVEGLRELVQTRRSIER